MFSKKATKIDEIFTVDLTLRKGLDTVESLSVEVKGSKNPGKRFLVM